MTEPSQKAADPKTKKKNDRNGTQQRFLSDCSIRAMEGEGNERKFILSFSSEEPYERYWGVEILSHASGAMDLTRLNSIGVVLFNHDRDEVLGKVLRAWVENNRGYAEIEFDDDPDADVIYQKVKNKTLKGVSVGYRVHNWEEVAANKMSSDGRFAGPCDIAILWEPFEISIVSVPADPTVGVGRSQEEPEAVPSENEKGVSSFYYDEKQLQINQNLLQEVKQNES